MGWRREGWMVGAALSPSLPAHPPASPSCSISYSSTPLLVPSLYSLPIHPVPRPPLPCRLPLASQVTSLNNLTTNTNHPLKNPFPPGDSPLLAPALRPPASPCLLRPAPSSCILLLPPSYSFQLVHALLSLSLSLSLPPLSLSLLPSPCSRPPARSSPPPPLFLEPAPERARRAAQAKPSWTITTPMLPTLCSTVARSSTFTRCLRARSSP